MHAFLNLILKHFRMSDLSLANGYCLPPKEIRDIVDAPPLPTLSFSPHRDKSLFLKRRYLPPLAELARPEEKLAGIRIDGKSNSRSQMSFYTGIGIHHIMDDSTLGPEREMHGLPSGAKLNFVSGQMMVAFLPLVCETMRNATGRWQQ